MWQESVRKCADGRQVLNAHDLDSSSSYAYNIKISGVKRIINDANNLESRANPVASVIWNPHTFNHFLALADQADLTITDLTSTLRPLDLLPYMKSFDLSSIRLFTVTSKYLDPYLFFFSYNSTFLVFFLYWGLARCNVELVCKLCKSLF